MMRAAKLWCTAAVAVAGVFGACERRVDIEPEPESLGDRDALRDPADLIVLAIISDPEQLVGRRVQFDAAEVQEVGTAGVLVGPLRSRNAVLVIPLDPRMLSGIEVGEQVRVAGVIKRMPPPAWALEQPRSAPVVQQAQRADLRIYVEAEQLQAPAPPIG